MDAQFVCSNPGRREAVRQQNTLNGIDYLEVASTDQRTLDIHFIHPLPGQPGEIPGGTNELGAANLVIEGGVQVRDVKVTSVTASADVLRVSVDRAGDFSTYTLRLVASATSTDAPPPGFDRALSSIGFSFKVECPSEFDCKVDTSCPPETPAEPQIDYLAKDYTSFRRLMLDRLSILMPDWQDRSPADVQVAMVELLAYVGDQLSYYQDAVATESYLGTARLRSSARRHARLLDYAMHDGCNARAWVHLGVTADGAADGAVLAAGTELRTRGDTDYLVFETMHDVALHSQHNRISFHTWSDSECCLPAGATRATLRIDDPARPLSLAVGDVLILEEICSPTTGLAADADPTHRASVRLVGARLDTDALEGVDVVEVEWHDNDALPFPLCLTALASEGAGAPQAKEISVARANVALADHGRTIADEPLLPEAMPARGRYRPRLAETDLSFAAPYTHTGALREAATSVVRQDPRKGLPQVTLQDADETWLARRDLLASDRFAPEFAIEVEHDMRAFLRFGDDVLGKAPSAGTRFRASYRVGNGIAGNVGPEAISWAVDVAGIDHVRNPLPAVSGAAPESIEEVRQYAPQAFRSQERAVTADDYAEMAQRHPGVQRAAARFRWTGSWYTVFVTIDRRGGLPVSGDTEFQRELREHLERFRLAGYDLEINGPVFVPLDLQLLVCVAPGYFRADVKQTLLQTFGRGKRPDGQPGFFHPDNFTFGQPVYLSQIYEAAMAVEGVASVEVTRFQRWGKTAADELNDAVLAPASLEVIRLDNDPSEPENGRLELDMHGGL